MQLSGVLLRVDATEDDLACSIADMIDHDTELPLLDHILVLHLIDDVAILDPVALAIAGPQDASHHAVAVIVHAELGLVKFDAPNMDIVLVVVAISRSRAIDDTKRFTLVM